MRQHYSNEVGIRLAVRGAQMFASAEEELGGPAGFEQIGYMLFAPPEGEQALRDIVPIQQSFGVETTLMEPAAVEGRWPELRLEGVALACYEPTSGFANPVLTVESLVQSAQRDGLAVYEGCEVVGITAADGRVAGVVTGDGEISTGVVVNACGPWGDRVGRLAGVDYPITFSREHEAVFEAPEDFGVFPVISDVPQRLYCRPFPGGKVLVGQGWPKEPEPADPETYDDGTDQAHLQAMVPKLLARLPALVPTLTQPAYGGAYVTGYSGVYDITEDWYPIVGEEELDGLLLLLRWQRPRVQDRPRDRRVPRRRDRGADAADRHLEPLRRPLLRGPHVQLRLGGREPRMSTARTLDPITFEVIRNALVAATDEMVLTLRRSAYSTNIKTRADFSCAFFDAELRAVAQGFTQPVHLGSMVEQVPQAVRSYGVSNLGAGRRDHHERAVPERRAPERRQPHLAGLRGR